MKTGIKILVLYTHTQAPGITLATDQRTNLQEHVSAFKQQPWKNIDLLYSIQFHSIVIYSSRKICFNLSVTVYLNKKWKCSFCFGLPSRWAAPPSAQSSFEKEWREDSWSGANKQITAVRSIPKCSKCSKCAKTHKLPRNSHRSKLATHTLMLYIKQHSSKVLFYSVT